MKALLEKIRKLLKDRRFRNIWYRSVSLAAAVLVFITTYALVLPAITMEKTAACGIEEHQHDSNCYESRLICGQEESEGHHHDDSCYTVTQEMVCDLEEHQHSNENGCYDGEGNLICEILSMCMMKLVSGMLRLLPAAGKRARDIATRIPAMKVSLSVEKKHISTVQSAIKKTAVLLPLRMKRIP